MLSAALFALGVAIGVTAAIGVRHYTHNDVHTLGAFIVGSAAAWTVMAAIAAYT